MLKQCKGYSSHLPRAVSLCLALVIGLPSARATSCPKAPGVDPCECGDTISTSPGSPEFEAGAEILPYYGGHTTVNGDFVVPEGDWVYLYIEIDSDSDTDRQSWNCPQEEDCPECEDPPADSAIHFDSVTNVWKASDGNPTGDSPKIYGYGFGWQAPMVPDGQCTLTVTITAKPSDGDDCNPSPYSCAGGNGNDADGSAKTMTVTVVNSCDSNLEATVTPGSITPDPACVGELLALNPTTSIPAGACTCADGSEEQYSWSFQKKLKSAPESSWSSFTPTSIILPNSARPTVTFAIGSCGEWQIKAIANVSWRNLGCISRCSATGEGIAEVEVTATGSLWWLNGVNRGGNYNTTTSLSGGGGSGTYTWIASGDIVLVNSGAEAGQISGENLGSITVKSTGKSGNENDATVELEIDGSKVCSWKLTVYAPNSLVQLGNPVDIIRGNGYQSSISYKILDQFGTPLRHDIPWNEDIDGNGQWSSATVVSNAATPDYTGEDWKWGAEGSGNASRTYFSDEGEYFAILTDKIRRPTTGGGTIPPPQNPTGNGAAVDRSVVGALYIGIGGTSGVGKGVKVKDVTWRIYQNRGRHE